MRKIVAALVILALGVALGACREFIVTEDVPSQYRPFINALLRKAQACNCPAQRGSIGWNEEFGGVWFDLKTDRDLLRPPVQSDEEAPFSNREHYVSLFVEVANAVLSESPGLTAPPRVCFSMEWRSHVNCIEEAVTEVWLGAGQGTVTKTVTAVVAAEPMVHSYSALLELVGGQYKVLCIETTDCPCIDDSTPKPCSCTP